jgi:tape measure domain-containing protein
MEGGDLSMSSIDDRVVKMEFDNKQFEAGTKQTMDSLGALNKTLQMEGATKGLTDIQAAGKNVQLGHIEGQANAVAAKFKAMEIIAITALATIAHQAIATGTQLIKSLTVDPLKSGLEEYETNLNSIQTILSNTQWQNTGLKDVTNALDILNHYSDQTIYNFSEMARNIGTFTAAGVKLEVAVDAIKGIANLAAVSGSNSMQAATAMYQLSQAISTGKVALMDWNSVVNAGMGGKVFQDSLMETARVHGVAIDKMVKDAGSFRNTLENGWLTGQILTETLSKFTGDLTAGQLKTMGYNEQQIAGILKMGKSAQDAATKVKTMSALINTLRESATSGWAKTWELIFGDFDEAKYFFTQVNDVLGGMIGASADARNEMIKDWKELTGRTELILAVKAAFEALMAVIKPIRDAFKSMFPPITGKQLYDLTVLIRHFAEGLIIGSETADKLRRTFAGVFAILGIGYDILKEVVKVFFRLFGLATEGSGSFLSITANIGDFLVALRKAIQDGQGFVKIFTLVGDVLSIPIKLIKLLAGYIGSLFDDFDAGGAAKAVTGLVGKFEPLTKIGENINEAWDKVAHTLDNVWSLFFNIARKAAAFFSEFGSGFGELFSGIDFQTIFAGINTGLFASIVLMFKNLFGSGSIFGSIKDTLSQLTDTMQTMQNTLRAATLLQIAAAIAILTLSVNALSKIDAEGLTRALTAITVMFTQLFSAMLILEKMSSFDDIAQMYAIAGAMVVLGVAIRILASSVKELAELNWNDLAKGLTGVTVLLAGVIAVGKFLPPTSGMISTAAGITILAVGIKILASAVTDLSGLSWEEMSKGLVGVGAVLAGLALFTKFAAVDKGGVLSGAGIVLLASGIKILASAMLDFATLSWEEIGKGLTATAGGLVLLGAALTLIPPTAPLSAAGVFVAAAALGMLADSLNVMGGMNWGEIGRGLTVLAGALTLISAALILIPPWAPVSAAGVLIVAGAIEIIGDALRKMSKMSWEEIAKGMTVLAGALTIIAVAMEVMVGALPGAAALLIVAGSLAILAPVISMFAQLSWEEIAKGLVTLAGAFTVIGLAGLILTPVVPTLLALGAAVTLIGAGMLLAGAGVLAFSVGLTALSISGAAGAAAIVAIVAGLAGIVPLMLKTAHDNIMLLAQLIKDSVPAMIIAMSAVILAIATAIDETSPKVMETLTKFLDLLLTTMEKNTPKFADKAFKILIAILTAIRDNIAKVSQLGVEITAEFINGIGRGLPKIIESGVNLILSFLRGLTKAINEHSEEMGKAGGDLAGAMIKGMANGLLSGASAVTRAAQDVAKQALKAAMKALGIASPSKETYWVGEMFDKGAADGIKQTAGVVTKAATGLGEDSIYALKKTLTGVNDLIKGDLDTTPVISPVLDLTSMRKSAEQIGGMFRTQTIALDTSVAAARDASVGYQANQDILAENGNVERVPVVEYNQYNNSPKALSNEEIYRNTKNQLSIAKKGAVS